MRISREIIRKKVLVFVTDSVGGMWWRDYNEENWKIIEKSFVFAQCTSWTLRVEFFLKMVEILLNIYEKDIFFDLGQEKVVWSDE